MRTRFLPFCLPQIGDEEVDEVVHSIRSGWVTTGPKVRRFEEDFANYVGSAHAIAVNSCTAALHLSLAACGVGPGDEVILPTMTFCATANVVVHLGATPVLVDTDEHGLICVRAIERAITGRTKAIIPVHYAGQSCALEEILALAQAANLDVVEDAAHAIGTSYRGCKIGTHGKTTAFSFYATKNMTTGEGGMVTTADESIASRLRTLSLHGMSKDAWKRYSSTGSWFYEVNEAGYKYNMTDIQASMGIHQLRRLTGFIARRREIAERYDRAFQNIPEIKTPVALPDRGHAYHLYPINLRMEMLTIDRGQFIEELKRRNIGSSVHFIPLHQLPRYRSTRGERFPVADRFFDGLLSLPLYPAMTDDDVGDVISAVDDIVQQHRSPSSEEYADQLSREAICTQ